MDFVVEMPNITNAATINAADFGLYEGNKDNTQVLLNAISYCREQKNCILTVKKGVYHFKNSDYITFLDMENFVFDGGSAEFVFSSPNFFRVKHSNHVEIKNCIVDFNWEVKRLASLCRIVNVDMGNHWVELEFFELGSIDLNFDLCSMNQFDALTLTPGTTDGKELWFTRECIVRREKGSKENAVRLYHTDGFFVGVQIGEIYLARHIWQREGCAFLIEDSEHITLTDNTIYSTAGLCHVVMGKSKYYRLNGEKICVRPGTNRRMSSEGDGFHIIQSRGYGIIENCDFSFMGDDDVNIHDCHMFVKARLTDQSILLENHGYGEAGDMLDVRNPDFSPAGYTLTLKELIYDEETRKWTIVLDECIPEHLGEGFILLNKSYSSSHYIIRNNYFHENRARGLLLQCDHGLVENNRFYKTQGAAVYIMLEALRGWWYEGSGVSNLTIRNNTFIDCNCANWSSVIDAISILPDEASAYTPFRNILIEKNKIERYPALAMYLSNADGVNMIDNEFITESDMEGQIIAERCGSISMQGNTINRDLFDQNRILRVKDTSERKNIKYLSYFYK